MKKIRIAVLGYHGCMPTQLFGIADVLRIAADIAQTPDMQVRVDAVALGDGEVDLAGGIRIKLKRPRGRYEVLVIPGMETSRAVHWSARLARSRPEIAFIQQAFSRGTQIASICVGAFLLGEAGLLDGRTATTAWLFARDLAERYPHSRINADAMLLEDGGVITTGAVSSAFDLALHLAQRYFGAAVAAATGRAALLQHQRSSQAPFIDTSMYAPAEPSFSLAVLRWLEKRMSEPYDLTRLAQAFHVSPRTMLRRIKQETAETPLGLLQRARVEKAKHLLLKTNLSIGRITEAVGYQDQVSFGKLFAQAIGSTPTAFRRQFRTMQTGVRSVIRTVGTHH
ncbi:MAG TPA: helix-turn-helix domain-containing protein [Burkholderiaceae bacterium]|nr:helix-turn-helix domain-containing protein [Burkholderiaceae bacterium]